MFGVEFIISEIKKFVDIIDICLDSRISHIAARWSRNAQETVKFPQIAADNIVVKI